jgi:hypothetical protein
MGLRRSTSTKEVDPSSLFLIDFNVPALTSHIHSAETALHFSENITLLAIRHIHTGIIDKDG